VSCKPYEDRCQGDLAPSARAAVSAENVCARWTCPAVAVLAGACPPPPCAVREEAMTSPPPACRTIAPRDPIRGHCQAGSLTGAVHLSKDNAGVLRPGQRGQKPRVEQKGKSWLDPDIQYG